MNRPYAERVDALETLTGNRKADLAVLGGRIVDVWSGEVIDGGIAVSSGTIVATGDVSRYVGESTEVIDAAGCFLTPGLIETHLHVYESNLSPTELARILLPHGTTVLPEAMYGGGQVCGLDAVRFFIEELRRTPITVVPQVPILGYLQNLELGLPGSPNSLDGRDLAETLDLEGCSGLEEPPYIPMLEKDPVVLDLMEQTLDRGKVVMGHGAGLVGPELDGYAAMGVTADHEAVSAEEALDRIRNGMIVSMRESCVARNQRDLQRAITEHGADPRNFMFCSDVLDPVEGATIGHIDQNLRIAVEGGVDPVAAVQMATLNAARYYRIDHAIGSLAPGRQADILLVPDISDFQVKSVVAKGELVVDDGQVVVEMNRPTYPAFLKDTVELARSASPEDFVVPAPSDAGPTVLTRVIGGDNLVSDERQLELPVVDGAVPADVDQDAIKLAMLDRYGKDDPPAIGFLQGYRLKRGAIGTTYNPMYHNVLVAGVNDADMAVAANALEEMGGGFVAVDDGEVTAVPLELCGLMSEAPASEVIPALERLYRKVSDLGCSMESPFHNLAFAAVCGELPFLKLSHKGIFDVQERTVLPLFVDSGGSGGS